MTPTDRPEANPALADKQTELVRLRDEYLARFSADPDIATFGADDAIAAMREALRVGRPLPPQDKSARRNDDERMRPAKSTAGRPVTIRGR